MKFTIALQNLPFKPERKQVIYIENEFCEEVNNVIRANIDQISRAFRFRHLEFVYIPFLGSDENLEERVKYYAPYLTSEITYDNLPQSSLLLSCMTHPENREKVQPSLIIYGYTDKKEKVFHGWTIDHADTDSINDRIITLSDVIHEYGITIGFSTKPSDADSPLGQYRDGDADPKGKFCISRNPEPCASPSNDEIRFSRKKHSSPLERFKERLMSRLPSVAYCLNEEEDSDSSCGDSCMLSEEIPEDMTGYEEEPLEDIMDDLQFTVKRLQLKGITLAAIHELIDKQEKLSKMVITPDYRIFLPEFNNIEIEMGTLPKALYFLFLRYPEGIILKTMPDHYTELVNIYKQLKPNAKDERIRVTITSLVNPLGNSINENIARIRAPFVKKFDEHLAQNYFITGTKGEEYRVSLDRDLIEWQE